MSTSEVTMVRVYLTEGQHKLAALLKYLHDESKVCGVTVFRGITGFGKSGRMHSSSLIDLSFNLPVVIEFFDAPEKAASIITRLNTMLEPGHVVWWPARISTNEGRGQ